MLPSFKERINPNSARRIAEAKITDVKNVIEFLKLCFMMFFF